MNGNTLSVLSEVADERAAQDERWGQQDHPNGTGPNPVWERGLAIARAENDEGQATYGSILAEEFFEAMLESDPAKLRVELIQVAAVAVKFVEKIDREAQRG